MPVLIRYEANDLTLDKESDCNIVPIKQSKPLNTAIHVSALDGEHLTTLLSRLEQRVKGRSG